MLALERLAGSIPACAGKPVIGYAAVSLTWVYPRVCGEACPSMFDAESVTGLSPRVRGSPRPQEGTGSLIGSIPACAGKPGLPASGRLAFRVYPRVCGEAQLATGICGGEPGLSPRVRGSPHGVHQAPQQGGSIPACAGKPAARPSSCRIPRVYPRVCGEADVRGHRRVLPEGLSPRVRGSLQARRGRGVRIGSIPACAGKPPLVAGESRAWQVYPRVCGEAVVLLGVLGFLLGLSPRVRGSPTAQRAREKIRGSIPACAGKPVSRLRASAC